MRARRIDLVAVEMEYRQDGAVRDRIEEFVAMPAGSKRASFGLAVAHHHESD
jgi:hypothetical protein